MLDGEMLMEMFQKDISSKVNLNCQYHKHHYIAEETHYAYPLFSHTTSHFLEMQ